MKCLQSRAPSPKLKVPPLKLFRVFSRNFDFESNELGGKTILLKIKTKFIISFIGKTAGCLIAINTLFLSLPPLPLKNVLQLVTELCQRLFSKGLNKYILLVLH